MGVTWGVSWPIVFRFVSGSLVNFKPSNIREFHIET